MEKLDFWCYLGGVSVAVQGIYHFIGTFLFVILLLFFIMCIRNAARAMHCLRGCV
jgi:hypothetical protein